MAHEIYVYGDIYNDQSDYASAWGIVSLTDVKNQMAECPADEDDVVVNIHTRGGDVFEGFAIHDFLKTSGKNITTKVVGLCASIGTVVFCAGETRQMTENAEFLIHNPTGIVAGDAEDIEDYAELLREIENKLLDLYVTFTGKDKREHLRDLMNEDKLISPEDAKELGFVTEVIETVKAVAYLDKNYLKNRLMKDLKEETKKTNTLLNTVLEKLRIDNRKWMSPKQLS